VVAYELLFGRRPFKGNTNSNLTQSITKDPVKFPEDVDSKCSREGCHFLVSLLDRDPRRRLGCKSAEEGFDEIKAHPWLRSIDWDALEAKQVPPPFVPDSKKANFDASHELEELLLEDNPLKARKRNVNLDVNNLTHDQRTLEEQFTIYDYHKMKRKSYFNTSQQLVSTHTGTSSQPESSRPNTPGHDPSAVSMNGNVDMSTKMVPLQKDEAMQLASRQ